MEERKACIARFREGVVRDLEKLAVTMTRETGKPIKMSRNELNGLLGRLDFFIGMVEPVTATETVWDEGGMRERIEHVPLGVVGNISAWNYPWFVGCNVIVPALLTGNAVLYKPSEYATLTGLEIARLLHEAGVPHDVFATLVGAGAVGAALLEQKIDGLFFTGSYATGARIAAGRGLALHEAAARARRQGPDLRLRRRGREGRRRIAGRRRHVQHRPELLLGRAHLRAREGARRVPAATSSRR